MSISMICFDFNNIHGQGMALKIIGHRGNGRTTETPFLEGKAPQSSLESFRQAIEDNHADGVEFDVFVSADGVPIVIERDEIDGMKISDLSYENFLGYNLAPDGLHPSLDEALRFLHDLGARLNRKLVINIELKGRSVTRPTLEAVERAAEEYGFDANQVHYSSFDRDKLASVRMRQPSAIIQPTIATTQLFAANDVTIPGYSVPLTAQYNKAALTDLSEFLTEFNCAAIDVPTCDIRPELIDFAGRHDVGFCTHPSGPRLYENRGMLVESFRLLHEYAEEQDVIIKVDDIALTRALFRQYSEQKTYQVPASFDMEKIPPLCDDGFIHYQLKENDLTYEGKGQDEILERIMGTPFLR